MSYDHSSRRLRRPNLLLSLLACVGLALLAIPALADVQVEVLSADLTDPVPPAAVETSATKSNLTSALVIPFYRVEADDPNGETTLYAIRNNADGPVDVRISYFEETAGTYAQVRDVTIAEKAVYTVNVRDVANLPSGNGVSKGFIVAELTGAAAGQPVLSGDYFRINPIGAAANGGALMQSTTASCSNWSHRFLSGGLFEGGTKVSFLVLNPPASGPVAIGNVYSEAGEFLGTRSLITQSTTVELTDSQLVLPVDFGTIDWVFQGGASGIVHTTFTADDVLSVGTEATCIDDVPSIVEPPLPDGVEVFQLNGTFLNCNGCGNWQYNMPFDSRRQFSKVVLDFDVFVGNFDPNKPRGFHCLFWLNNGTRWQDMMGYLNSRGTSNRTTFQVNGPLGNPIGVEKYANSGVQQNTAYHVHYEYDTINDIVTYEITDAAGNVRVADFINLPGNTGPLSTNYTFIQFGSQPGGAAESLTNGWRWSNFRAQFIP